MPAIASRKIRVLLFFFLASLLAVSVLPTLNAATPTPRATPGSKSTPTPTPGFIPVTTVFADTNVPLITNVASSSETIDDQFVVSVALDVRIRRNTVTSINIGLAQRTNQGAFIDPIFQAPCTKLSNLSVNSLNSTGDSTALQSRAIDGDWYVEKYVLTSRTKLGTNQVPCLGQYMITSMALVDSAKHTLNVVANLASTVPVAAPSTTSSTGQTRVSTPQSTSVKNNDTAIMTSNVWNSRIDVAPCTPGTNLLPTTTTQRVGSANVPVTTQPTIIPTNRVACPAAINFDFSKPLITIVANSDVAGLSPIAAIGVGGGLPIFDYAAANQGSDIEKLKKEIEELKKKNAKLTTDLAKFKKTKVTTKKPTPRASPSPTRRSSSSGSQGQSNWDGSPTRRSAPTP